MRWTSIPSGGGGGGVEYKYSLSLHATETVISAGMRGRHWAHMQPLPFLPSQKATVGFVLTMGVLKRSAAFLEGFIYHKGRFWMSQLLVSVQHRSPGRNTQTTLNKKVQVKLPVGLNCLE